MTLDIKNYFPSISHHRVYNLFSDLGCSPDVSCLLTKLTTHKWHVPQGTPTASSIANLVTTLWIEPRLRALCDREGFNLTIYVDDISISGPYRLIGFKNTFLKILTSSGFAYREGKIKIQRIGLRQTVTGHTVNQGMAPTREWRERLRTQLRHLERDLSTMSTKDLEERVKCIRGRISHMRQFLPEKGCRLEDRLNSIITDCGSDPDQFVEKRCGSL